MRYSRAILIVAAALALAGCSKKERKGTPGESSAVGQGMAVDIRDPKSCSPCHAQIASEYGASMHARAHHSKDPIYRGVREIRRRKEGVEVLAECASCHTPGFESDPEAAEAAVGVACFTCHNTRVGAKEGTLLGPSVLAAGASPAHGTGDPKDAFADGTSLCLGCHASLESPGGVSICATGAEHESAEGDAKRRCVDCHMPKAPGAATIESDKELHSSHAFLGAHAAWYQDDPAFARSAFSLKSSWQGSQLSIAITNRSGHALPTGFPGRQMVIRCEGKSASQDVTWSCEPGTLGKKHVDAEGKPTLAPYAQKLASDTRLKPGETRTLAHVVPADVEAIEVTVAMRLLPETLAKKIAISDATEAEERVIHSQSLEPSK